MNANRCRCEALILEESLIADLRWFGRRLDGLRKYPRHNFDRRLPGFGGRLDVLARCLWQGGRFGFEKRQDHLHGCSPHRRWTLAAVSNLQ